jgi:DNA anti-recombination protein RmuC
LPEGAGADPSTLARSLVERCDDPEVTNLIAEASTSALAELDDQAIGRQLRLILKEQARELARRLRPAIEAAEREGNREELQRLLEEKTRLRQEPPEP